MKLVSLKCRDCRIEMAKLTVPVINQATGGSNHLSGIICVPCAENARLTRLNKEHGKIAVIH